MRFAFSLLFLVCAIGSEWVYANPSYSPVVLAAASASVESAKPKLNKQKAASRAKRAYPDSKILSVKLIGGSGPAVYRLKMISSNGVVKYVFVDGNTGSVFE